MSVRIYEVIVFFDETKERVYVGRTFNPALFDGLRAQCELPSRAADIVVHRSSLGDERFHALCAELELKGDGVQQLPVICGTHEAQLLESVEQRLQPLPERVISMDIWVYQDVTEQYFLLGWNGCEYPHELAHPLQMLTMALWALGRDWRREQQRAAYAAATAS